MANAFAKALENHRIWDSFEVVEMNASAGERLTGGQ